MLLGRLLRLLFVTRAMFNGRAELGHVRLTAAGSWWTTDRPPCGRRRGLGRAAGFCFTSRAPRSRSGAPRRTQFPGHALNGLPAVLVPLAITLFSASSAPNYRLPSVTPFMVCGRPPARPGDRRPHPADPVAHRKPQGIASLAFGGPGCILAACPVCRLSPSWGVVPRWQIPNPKSQPNGIAPRPPWGVVWDFGILVLDFAPDRREVALDAHPLCQKCGLGPERRESGRDKSVLLPRCPTAIKGQESGARTRVPITTVGPSRSDAVGPS